MNSKTLMSNWRKRADYLDLVKDPKAEVYRECAAELEGEDPKSGFFYHTTVASLYSGQIFMLAGRTFEAVARALCEPEMVAGWRVRGNGEEFVFPDSVPITVFSDKRIG